MKFLKALISWKLWLSIILGIALLVGLWFYTFKFLDNYTNHGVEVEVPNLANLNVNEAIQKLEDLDLKYEIDSVRFTEDYPPHAILEFYPAQGSKVKPGRRIFIKSNPSTWSPVQLPDLIDKSSRLAITQLNLRGFVLGDTIYVKDAARDAVLNVLFNGDTIAAGELLPKGAKIDLVLGRGYNMDVPVPNVEGLSLQAAKDVLKNNYFDLGQIYNLNASQDTMGVRVFYQDPPPNDLYDEGLPVSLWLSSKKPSDLRRYTDSLDIVYRRKIDEKDSLFRRSIENSKSIDIRDLPEEIRNAVRYEQTNTSSASQEKAKRKTGTTSSPKIDTAGISIN